MLFAVRLADALQPRVQRLVVELNRVIGCGLKLVRVKVLDHTFLPPSAYRLLSRFAACEDLHVHHVVLLLSTLRIKVDTRVEDQVARLHFFKFQIDRTRIILVRLIPAVKFKAKVFPQVIYDLANEGTTIQEKWRVIKWITRVVVPLGIGYAKVLDAPVYKFLPELPLEVWISPVRRSLLSHIVAILNFFLFSLAEPVKVGLETTRLSGTSETQ